MAYEETPWKNKLFYLPRAGLQEWNGEATKHHSPDNQKGDPSQPYHSGMWVILECYLIQNMGPGAENDLLREDRP